MAGDENNRGAFHIQAFYCREMDAPIYARLCDVIATGLTRASKTGAAILDWAGEPTRDALPLRFIGGLHALVLAGADADLAEVFSGMIDQPAAIETVLARVLIDHDDALLPWLDGPPQTNEPGRSAALMTGLLAVAGRLGPKVEIIEIGSSGGLNLLIDRYRFDFAGAMVGPEGAPVTITPEWRGAPPATPPLDIVSTRGCDIRVLDVTDKAVEARLLAYVWAERPERVARLKTAIAMVSESGVALEQADAADWLEAQLARPQPPGVTRALLHSVVWQYLPEATAQRIREAMAAAGARADATRPLAWVAMEPDRAMADMIVSIRTWPGAPDREVVATCHAHAAWINPGSVGKSGSGHPLVDGAAQIIL